MVEKVYIVSYDIREKNRLNKVHKTMCDYGKPIQYSVFECTLTDKNLVKMKYKLSEIVNPENDQVLIIPLCISCGRNIAAIGYQKPESRKKVIIL